uniref:Aminotransferase class I and II n=1 Tax=Roseihalotalea indica TaxID=2867963 RepID=A0AA49JJ02_9BACT|nr:aminotransferase class I and II [Tunicatimonas sp. TK19036]
MNKPEIRTVDVVRYVKPLREGGSLPAIVEADDGFLYVLKFRGAGQGKKALIAELIGGELARTMSLKVPELVFMNLDDSFSKTEPDEEIQDLLRFSVGLNLGLHYLSGAITYDPLVSVADPLTASKVVLLDSLISNVDRTYKNTNMLNWHRELWLIDHGASLYFHHAWNDWKEHASRTFPRIKDHVLLNKATMLPQAAQEIKLLVTSERIQNIVSVVPDDWLLEEPDELSPQERREVYVELLSTKLANIDVLANEADDARKTSV